MAHNDWSHNDWYVRVGDKKLGPFSGWEAELVGELEAYRSRERIDADPDVRLVDPKGNEKPTDIYCGGDFGIFSVYSRSADQALRELLDPLRKAMLDGLEEIEKKYPEAGDTPVREAVIRYLAEGE